MADEREYEFPVKLVFRFKVDEDTDTEHEMDWLDHMHVRLEQGSMDALKSLVKEADSFEAVELPGAVFIPGYVREEGSGDEPQA